MTEAITTNMMAHAAVRAIIGDMLLRPECNAFWRTMPFEFQASMIRDWEELLATIYSDGCAEGE